MSSIQQQYAELVALSQLYLTQEFSAKDWVTSYLDTYHYFKQFVRQKKEVTVSQPPLPTPRPATVLNELPPQKPPIKPPEKKTSVPPAPKEETPKIETLKEDKKTVPFALAPMSPYKEHDLTDIKKIVMELFPHQKIIEHPPSDQVVQQQYDVILLHFDESGEEQALLVNLSKAIQDRFAKVGFFSAQQVEKENKWESLLNIPCLRLVLVSEQGLQRLPTLSQHLQKEKQIPLCLLSEISIYLQQPELKRTLWKTICKHLA